MPSVLDGIVDFTQLQRRSATPDAPLQPSPPTPPGGLDPPVNSESPYSSSEDEEEDEVGVQPPLSTKESPSVAAFTVNTARNFQLSSDGEKSLLRFSLVILLSLLTSPFFTLLHSHCLHVSSLIQSLL